MIERARRLAVHWTNFWHAEASPLALGLFRILFAYCLFREVRTTRYRSVFAIAGDGYHLPYVDFIQPVPEWIYGAIHDLQYPLIVLLGIGLYTRFSCAALLVLQSYIFFADQLNFRNHPYFFLLVLLLLLLSPAGEALALQPLLRALRQGRSVLAAFLGPARPLTMQRLIQVQVCLAYGFAGLHKLRPAFLEGPVLHRILAEHLPTKTSGDFLVRFLTQEDMIAFFQTGWVFAALAWATAALELSLPVAIWFRCTRWPAIVCGTFFHLSIAFVMEIHVFSYAMIGSYLLFLQPDALSRVASRLSRRLEALRLGSGERLMAGLVRPFTKLLTEP